MRRGTTPNITATVGSDLTGMTVYFTFECGDVELTKSGDDVLVSVADGKTTVSTRLTQEDTLSFEEGEKCEMQIRATDGYVAVATTIGSVKVERILLEGEIHA